MDKEGEVGFFVLYGFWVEVFFLWGNGLFIGYFYARGFLFGLNDLFLVGSLFVSV